MIVAGEAPLWTLISGSAWKQEQSTECHSLLAGEVTFQALRVPCQDHNQQWELSPPCALPRSGFWDTGGILHMEQRSRAPVVTLQQSWAWPHPKAALQRRAQWQAGLLHSLPAHTAPAEGRPEPT